ncbi:MAG: EAL domain-containing protein [Pseudomonadota bacterium]
MKLLKSVLGSGRPNDALPISRLLLIPLLTPLLVALVVFGLAQVSKGGHLHQLNARHAIFSFQLTSILEETAKQPLPTDELIHLVEKIRSLPVECLHELGVVERLLMRAAGTIEAITLCVDDIATADVALASLAELQAGELTEAQVRVVLDEAADAFVAGSYAFEVPISRTVGIAIRITFAVVVLGGLLVWGVQASLARFVGRAMVGMEDATRALSHSEQLNKLLARIDSVTALPNRSAYTLTLQEAIENAQRKNTGFAVLFLDLDGFKNVNDDLGHSAGDLVLKTTAMRLAARMRGEDVVARFGGDEFAALLQGVDDAQRVNAVCDDLIKRVAEEISYEEHLIGVTTSIGVALYPQHGDDAERLMKHADIAMYEAKAQGKNRSRLFDYSLQDRITDRVRTHRDLTRAIEQRELHVHFQPVVDLNTLRVEGCEALVRWNHPDRGKIPPDVFIPIAEESDLILDLGAWVMETACGQAQAWRVGNGREDLRVAINVSPRQLATPGFARTVEQVLADTGLPASALDLEITETCFIGDDETCIASLHQLAELGARLLLDDFGTGYSSFSYLHTLPFQVLKIDRSLVAGIESGEKTQAIVTSILSMSSSLGMSVIAEGVETQAALDTLIRLGCPCAQGYFFQPPVAAEMFDLGADFGRRRSAIDAPTPTRASLPASP